MRQCFVKILKLYLTEIYWVILVTNQGLSYTDMLLFMPVHAGNTAVFTPLKATMYPHCYATLVCTHSWFLRLSLLSNVYQEFCLLDWSGLHSGESHSTFQLNIPPSTSRPKDFTMLVWAYSSTLQLAAMFLRNVRRRSLHCTALIVAIAVRSSGATYF
jgi:hypothetical protein